MPMLRPNWGLQAHYKEVASNLKTRQLKPTGALREAMASTAQHRLVRGAGGQVELGRRCGDLWAAKQALDAGADPDARVGSTLKYSSHHAPVVCQPEARRGKWKHDDKTVRRCRVCGRAARPEVRYDLIHVSGHDCGCVFNVCSQGGCYQKFPSQSVARKKWAYDSAYGSSKPTPLMVACEVQ